MNKLLLLVDLLRKGEEIADKEKWKNRQITTTAVAAVIVVLSQISSAVGYPLPLSEETITLIASGVVAVVNLYLTLATSSSVGILPEKNTKE